MRLYEIIEKLKEQQSLIKPEPDMAYVRDLVLAAHIELAEVLQELPWKPWKSKDTQPNNKLNAIKEVIDTIIFCFEIIIALGMEDKIEDLFGEIFKKIDGRIQEENYGCIKRS